MTPLLFKPNEDTVNNEINHDDEIQKKKPFNESVDHDHFFITTPDLPKTNELFSDPYSTELPFIHIKMDQ